jgi:hypothetical protein
MLDEVSNPKIFSISQTVGRSNLMKFDNKYDLSILELKSIKKATSLGGILLR